MAEPSKIRGAVMKDPRDWLRTAYGADAYQSALNRLAPEERAMVDGAIYASTWYPIEVWDRFLSGMRDEAYKRNGETLEQFNRRFMMETGSAIARGVYRFVLGLLSPMSVVDKATVIYNRVYSEGRCQVVENVPGRAVVQYVDASPGVRTNLSNHFPTGFVMLLTLHGAEEPAARISRDEVVDGKLVFEVTVTYRVRQ